MPHLSEQRRPEMIVNASQVVRYLQSQGVADAWTVYDKATIAQISEWAPLARESEKSK